MTVNRLVPEDGAAEPEHTEQLDLFGDYAARELHEQRDRAALERERRIQEAMLGIKKKYGKNAILSGESYQEGATARERNGQIGGHKL